ncbi:MAG: HDIG domain-containing protein [Deltaproteobacteria bacterium]|nr:HDIG domain-containing protein [Deltaproteobacteria bacterium]
MLDNIRAHSLVVARIAEFLGRELIKRGLDLNIDLVVGGALLHDIGKTACLNNGRNHALLGADICNTHGFNEVAPLVAQHVILADDLPGEPDARQIVYYADKRVNHDQVVSLEARLAYIVERYGFNDSRRCAAIRRNFNRCYEIEKTIFSYLGEEPEYLLRSLPRQSDFEIKAA